MAYKLQPWIELLANQALEQHNQLLTRADRVLIHLPRKNVFLVAYARAAKTVIESAETAGIYQIPTCLIAFNLFCYPIYLHARIFGQGYTHHSTFK